ncbi:STAS domain-containing protein [Lentzea pudingi]|uniref:STAS domain-containing protein n=1 Tax=Lentzea pudingi TaxID=1789439 RepID=UPI00166C9B4D|nr:STAS domain-containing protein [Lentzea pudingi]
MQTSDYGGVPVAVVSGELDMTTVDSIGTALFELVDAHPKGLVVYLAVTFMASSGISMVLELYGQSQRDRYAIVFVTSGLAASRPLKLSGLDQVLPLADTVDDAVNTLRQQRASSR